MIAICGFLVVRKPEYAFEPTDNSQVFHELNGIKYGGVDRLPWWDVIEDYYAGKRPQQFKEVYKKIQSEAIHRGDYDLCRDMSSATALLEYSNQSEHRNELIAIYSDYLASIRGALSINADNLEFLGYDAVVRGEWSLIGSGLFVSPTHFQQWIGKLNANGLFDFPPDQSEFLKWYKTGVQFELVEPLSDEHHVVDMLHIYRVNSEI